MKQHYIDESTGIRYGCLNCEATVERLRMLAALTPDPAAKKLFYMLSVKVSDEKCDDWYVVRTIGFAKSAVQKRTRPKVYRGLLIRSSG